MSVLPSNYDLGRIIRSVGASPPAQRTIPEHLAERGKGWVAALQARAASIPSIERIAGEISERWDSWQNGVTGQGTSRDKTTYGYVLPDRLLADTELSAIYHHDDMGGRMVDIVPQEMFRQGFWVHTGDPGLDAVCKEKHRQLDTRQNLMEGQQWGRCFGGGATLIGCDDGLPMEEPLRAENANDVDFLLTFDRRYVWPLTYYSGIGSKMGKVETYLVTSTNASGYLALSTAVVHESRLILHRGMPTAAREKLQLASWDLSVYQRAYAVLRQFNVGWAATEQLMADGNQAVFTIGGLQAIIAAGGEEMLRERIKAMDQFRSVVNGIVLDADSGESFKRESASLEGWPQTLNAQMVRLSAAVEVPVTILMGQSPAGMNATGESDYRNFYDRIGSKQTNDAAPQIERLTIVWFKTKAGRKALEAARSRGQQITSVEARFPNLWRETPKDKAARELSIAQRDQIYATIQTFSPDQIALVRGQADGFDKEIVLSREEAKALEERVHTALGLPEVDDAEEPGEGAEEVPTIELTQEDMEAIVTVDEARKQMDLDPIGDERGQMTLAEIKKGAALKPEPEPPAEKPDPEPKPDPEDPEEDPSGGGGGGGTKDGVGGPDGGDDGGGSKSFGHADAKERPRTFTLQRDDDETGVSGTGEVAHGVLWANGKVTLSWLTETSSVTQFDDFGHVLKVHGHGGKTRVLFHDEKRADAWMPIRSRLRLDAVDPKKLQEKEAKKAAAAAKDMSKAAWAKTHEAQQASKHAAANPKDKGAQAKAAQANKDAASAHQSAGAAWENATHTAEPGSGRFQASAAVMADHAHQSGVHQKEAVAHEGKTEEGAGGGGFDEGKHSRDETGKFDAAEDAKAYAEDKSRRAWEMTRAALEAQQDGFAPTSSNPSAGAPVAVTATRAAQRAHEDAVGAWRIAAEALPNGSMNARAAAGTQMTHQQQADKHAREAARMGSATGMPGGWADPQPQSGTP